jgi:hypothetical protein
MSLLLIQNSLLECCVASEHWLCGKGLTLKIEQKSKAYYPLPPGVAPNKGFPLHVGYSDYWYICTIYMHSAYLVSAHYVHMRLCTDPVTGLAGVWGTRISEMVRLKVEAMLIMFDEQQGQRLPEGKRGQVRAIVKYRTQ